MTNRHRTRIGLIVPSTNTTCEADFQMVAPPDVTIHSHRLWITNDAMELDGMEAMNAEIESAAQYLGTANVDIIAYGCTTGSFYKGLGWDEEMVELIENASGGIPAIGTSTSIVQALRHLKAKKISVATPYPKWNNDRLQVYLKAQGFEVLNIEGEPIASKSGNQGINEQAPETIVEFASSLCLPEADVLLCSCTAWRSMEAAQELELQTRRPIVTSNQSMVWSAFRRIGVDKPVQGFGKILDELNKESHGYKCLSSSESD